MLLLLLRPRPLRFCCPCLIGSVLDGYENDFDEVVFAELSPALAAPPVCGEDPQPVVTEEPTSAPTAAPSPSAEAPTASAIDPALVGWIGGGVLAAGLVVAAAILIASRRRRG